MKRFVRPAVAAFLLAALLPLSAAAETTIAVNDNNTGVFDQPSVAMSGAVAHVVYIGDNAAAGTFRVYYAAVNGAADFTNLALPRDNTVLLTFPLAVDNTDAGNDAYGDARHPRILLRSATEAVIFFQGTPVPSPDGAYKPYIARVTLAGNTVTNISVRRVVEPTPGPFSAGHAEDISFGIAAADNTARMACAVRPAAVPAGPFQVYFSRIGLDNATVVDNALLLSSATDNTATGSNGFRPVPSLRLDSANRSHVAWAATDNATTNPGPIYYSLVKAVPDVGGPDNVAIGATRVIAAPRRWAHPTVLAAATNAIIVVAGDESAPGLAGPVARVQFNPDAVAHTGAPVQPNTLATFFTLREETLPSTFDLYRPEAFLDSVGRVHMTGYGVSGTSPVYYAMTLTGAFPFADLVTIPATVGFSEPPGEIGESYTKAAFGYVSGKAVVFSSGLIAGSANLNVNVTTVPTVTVPVSSEEHGCSMVRNPAAGERGRVPGTLVLFLPAAALYARRLVRAARRKRGKAVGA